MEVKKTSSGATEKRVDHDRDAALGLAFMQADYGYPLAVPTGKLSPHSIWRSSDNELMALLKIPAASQEKLTRFRREFDASLMIKKLQDTGAEFVALGEPEYPPLLAKIHDPPAGLFLTTAGTDSPRLRLHDLASRSCIAIVGARAASRYGIDAAEMIGEELSRAGVCVVSGMATGIDAAGHRGALRSEGSSMAVLGCGPDVIYPRSNTNLYHMLISDGLILSEYPPGTEPRPWRFPARNRIIAGLALGVIVVEAKEKSGALITADFCLEEGREVWAVPGSIFSDLSMGPHGLLRLGAGTVTSAEDVLRELGITTPDDASKGNVPEKNLRAELTEDERLVLGLLETRPALPDFITNRASIEGYQVAAALITLELKGLARNDPVRGYSR